MAPMESYHQQAALARLRAERATTEAEHVAAVQAEHNWSELARRAALAEPHEQAALRAAADQVLGSADAAAALKLSASIIAEAADSGDMPPPYQGNMSATVTATATPAE